MVRLHVFVLNCILHATCYHNQYVYSIFVCTNTCDSPLPALAQQAFSHSLSLGYLYLPLNVMSPVKLH
jgi:hypothetical protein